MRAAQTEGAWTAQHGLPDYVMHAAVLHTGELMMWGWQPQGTLGADRRRNTGEAWLWDLSQPLPSLTDGTGTAFRRVDPPPAQVDADEDGDDDTVPAPLYCAGLSFLADGRVLVAGGNRAFPSADESVNWKGLNSLFVYDPATRTWSKPAGDEPMVDGRWYPTQTLLADGRTFIQGGYDSSGQYTSGLPRYVNTPDLFTPGTADPVEPRPAGWNPSTYPHTFLMPSGNLLMRSIDGETALLRTGDFSWAYNFQAPDFNRVRRGSNAVLWPEGPGGSDRILQLGGYRLSPAPRIANAETRAFELGDEATFSERTWSAGSPLNIARANANTVLLPGGGLVVVGGGRGESLNDSDPQGPGQYWTAGDESLKRVELYDPATGTWRLGAAQRQFRAYHSVALLLPDGRVWSAGDDFHEDETRTSTGSPWRGNAELYTPPYLFAPDGSPAPRPAVTDAPESVAYADTLGVGGSGVERVVLMSPAATTHGVDMSQRHVELAVVRREGHGVDAVAPAKAELAPPGWYMLFALNAAGTPSVARWVRLDPAAPDRALLGPPPAAPGGSPTPAAPRAEDAARLFASVRAVRLRTLRRTGRIRLTLGLDRAGTARVEVRLALRGPGARRRYGRSVVRGTAAARLVAGRRRTVTVRLGTRTRKLLRGAVRVKVEAAVTARDGTRTLARRTARRVLR